MKCESCVANILATRYKFYFKFRRSEFFNINLLNNICEECYSRSLDVRLSLAKSTAHLIGINKNCAHLLSSEKQLKDFDIVTRPPDVWFTDYAILILASHYANTAPKIYLHDIRNYCVSIKSKYKVYDIEKEARRRIEKEARRRNANRHVLDVGVYYNTSFPSDTIKGKSFMELLG